MMLTCSSKDLDLIGALLITCPGEVIVVHFILGLGCQKVQQFLLLSFFPYKSIIFGAFALVIRATHFQVLCVSKNQAFL